MSGRTYGGAPLEQRRADRRERLIAAGIELFGGAGYEATTVKAICDAANLTERYFYEHFATRLELLEAVFEQAVAITAERTFAAAVDSPAQIEARVRAGLDGYLAALSDDPRIARIQLVEAIGRGERLEARRFEVMREFAGAIEREAIALDDGSGSISAREHAVTLALVGATNHLAAEWVRGELRMPRQALLDALVALYLAAAELELPAD